MSYEWLRRHPSAVGFGVAGTVWMGIVAGVLWGAGTAANTIAWTLAGCTAFVVVLGTLADAIAQQMVDERERAVDAYRERYGYEPPPYGEPLWDMMDRMASRGPYDSRLARSDER